MNEIRILNTVCVRRVAIKINYILIANIRFDWNQSYFPDNT